MEAVLEFDNATLDGPARDQIRMEGLTFLLQPGGLLLLRLESEREHLPLCDAAEGLIAPDSGRISFVGEEWKSSSPGRASQLRSRIRRVFDGQAWMSNLDVVENITLAERHSTIRPVLEIVAEAENLARSFGLDGVPSGRPAWVGRSELRRAEWVRAFMGAPALVLLERPMAGVPREEMGGLIKAVQAARSQSAAVLWTTTEPEEWNHRDLADADRYTMRGQAMLRAGGDKS